MIFEIFADNTFWSKGKKHRRLTAMKGKTLVISVFLLMVFALAVPARAGWIDDWVQQKVTSGPDYFEGQKRGYVTFGQFQARVPMQKDYLLSIEAPRLKVGCGGIDMFLGGLSFLNFDLLVQKAQRIIQAAPFMAFQIALQVLLPQVASTLEAIEAIINQLNNLALDECKAEKAIVATAVDVIKDPSSVEKKMSDIAQSFKESEFVKGISSNWQKMTESFKNTGSSKVTASDAVSGCPDQLKDVFATNGSLLAKVASQVGLGGDTDMVKVIRGLIGDVEISVQQNVIRATYIKPCDDNGPDPYSRLTSSSLPLYRRPQGGSCELVQDKGVLESSIRNMLAQVQADMINKSAFASDVTNFIQNMPAPVYQIVKASVMSGDSSILESSIPLITTAYAYFLISDTLAKGNAILETAQHIQSRKVNPNENCKYEVFAESMQSVAMLKQNAEKVLSSARGEYMKQLYELATLSMRAQQLVEQSKIVSRALARRVGNAALANRM